MKKPRKSIYYVDGSYVSADEARVSVHDLGFGRGFALFESLRTYGGKPFLLKPHLDRMFQAAQKIGLRSPVNRAGIQRIIRALFQKNGREDLLIRIYLTGGRSHGLLPGKKGTLVILADPFHPFPAWQYEKGLHLKSIPAARIHPGIKSTVYFTAVFENAKALRQGYHEIVYRDDRGAILEGSTFNVIAVLPGSVLVFASEGVLAGVTVNAVLKLARQMGFRIVRQPISPSLLRKAQEMFITSSNRELIPVVRMDRQKIGSGHPGPATHRLHAAYRKRTQGG